MERASRLMGQLTSGGGPIDVDDLARAAWPLAVGKKVAARSIETEGPAPNRVIVKAYAYSEKKSWFEASRH